MLYKIDPRKKNSRRWNGRYRSTRCNLSSRFYWIKYLSLIMNTVREPPLAIPCRSGWCPSINKCLRCKVPYGMRGVSGLPKQLSSKNPWSVLRSKVGFMVLLPSRHKNKTRLKRSLSLPPNKNIYSFWSKWLLLLLLRLLLGSLPVWTDLAKIRHFGKTLNNFGKF